jgi:hypothetical protein
MTCNFRNPVYSSADGQQIDMEIEHPVCGWIPFTARPDDVEQLGRDLYAVALLGEVGAYVAPPPPPIEDYEAAIQARVDQTAVLRQFRDGVTLASYVASTNIQWAAEAQAFIGWRDQVWAYAYQEMARVQAGERAQPSVVEILSELPDVVWP